MSVQLHLQTNNKTFLGRHWTEHNVLRRYTPSDKDLAILSFGCSTGEELVSLNLLFPNANLYGCDRDWANLQSARALLGDKAIIFHSSEKEISKYGPYDIIICNSVLLRHTTVENGRKRGIDPAQWSDAVSQLDSVLKPGGLWQIICSNIPFRYHPIANGYEVLRSPLLFTQNAVDVFNLDGTHLCSGVSGAGWSCILNRHLGEEGWKELRPTDLHDVHFFKQGGPIPPLVEDEMIPNLSHPTRLASGAMTYRPDLGSDPRPSTHLEVDVGWAATDVDAVRLGRTVRRIWFDGSTPLTYSSVIDLTGPAATAYLEAAVGRRSTTLATASLFDAEPILSPSFK